MTALSKLDVARRELGTALWLFLEDLDPVSVHILTGAGNELAEGLARHVGRSPFIEHVLKTNPAMSQRKYYALARQYYNAFKHLTDRKGAVRDDEELLRSFTDEKNDALLFVAWTNFNAASDKMPIEAQVFQVWFYASHPEKMARRADGDRFVSVFPRLNELSRREQKVALKSEIAKVRRNTTVMNDPATDRRPLLWRSES